MQTRRMGKNLLPRCQGLGRNFRRIAAPQIVRARGRHRMAPMTRTQTRAYGVVTPSSRQPLLEAMLRVFALLVSNVALLFGAILNRRRRDWHTDAVAADQRPAANEKQHGAPLSQPSFSGKAAGCIPRTPVASTQGTTPHSLWSCNQDARHKAEHGSSAAESARTSIPPPNGGGAPRAHTSTMAPRWGTSLSKRTVRTRRTTVPHLTSACSAHLACSSSPVRGRKTPAHA